MLNLFLYIVLGVFIGIVSGLIGLGGGIIVIPLLVYAFGFSQHMAQGTSLMMMVPPIGILAAMAYYKQGYVNITAAGLLCVGFVLGGYIGAKFALGISEIILRKIFGVFLFIAAGYIMFK